MVNLLATALSTTIDRFVRLVVVPVTAVIPRLVSSGLMLLAFAGLWTAFLAAMALDPARLDTAWSTLGGLPLPVQAVAWLLFLPLTAGLWTWSTDWPVAVRVLVIVAIAGWNLLVFLPRREPAPAVSAR